MQVKAMHKVMIDGSPATKKGMAKVAVQCSADTFVVNQSLVLRINICDENRHLRQAREHKCQFHRNPLKTDNSK